MSDDQDADREGEFASWLAACDDALAAGGSAPPLAGELAPSGLLPRLERELAWCQFVRQAWTEDAPRDDGIPPDPPPDRIGRFEVVRELGRGAFGVVFLAYDPRLRREVALKVPRPEALLTADLRARFRQESQAAAALDHPNLVPVFDAGEEGMVCYIASAYCPGITLAGWLKGRDRPVPIRAAARLVATLAGAIEHAHRHGVLHRDLKPTNVILESPDGPDLVPRVTDFGLAKLVEPGPGGVAAALRTHSGTILGTPAYMAPEQAGGRAGSVGPPADVYALGAILYEVITGRPIFQGDSAIETLLLVRTQPPVPPARLRPGVPRDLETICLKCLEKEPRARYPSAEGLAADLERFLAGEPIHARPASPLVRLGKWSRRRPAAAALLALAILLPPAVLGVVVQANLRLRRERNYSESQRLRAVANLGRAQDAVNRMLTRVATDRLKDVPQMESITRALLEDALELNRGFIDLAGGDPGVRFEAGRSYHRLGESYAWLGPKERAETCFREAIALLSRLAAEAPGRSDYRRELAVTRQHLGNALRKDGRLAEAGREFRSALDIQRALAGLQPDDPAYQSELASTYNSLGALAGDLGSPREQEEGIDAALDLYTDLAARFPAVAEYQSRRAVMRNNMAAFLEDARRPAEAEALYRQNLAFWEGLVAREPGVVDHLSKLALTLENLGDLLEKDGRACEADSAFGRALALREKLAEDFPNSPYFRRRQGDLARRLSDLSAKRGERAEARRLLDRAVACRRAVLASSPRDVESRRSLRADLSALVEATIGDGDHAAAARAKAELSELGPDAPRKP